MEFLVLIELKLELNDHFDKPTRKDGLQIFFCLFWIRSMQKYAFLLLFYDVEACNISRKLQTHFYALVFIFKLSWPCGAIVD